MSLPQSHILTADADLVTPFARAAESFFRTMLGVRCAARWPIAGGEAGPLGPLSASVELLGSVSGQVTIHMGEDVACRIVSRITGIDLREPDDLVFDGLGEMANIIGGHGKRELEHLELRLGLPQVLRPGHPALTGPHWRRRIWTPLDTDLGDCALEVSFEA